jgi:hypothetical protein
VLNKNDLIVRFIAILWFITNYACDWPFKTKTSNEELFELSINHEIERVMPTAQVLLSWSELTVENFDSFRIERMTTNDTSWTLIKELNDEFLTSYLDTIGNDDDLLYRVGIVDYSDDIIWATGSTTIPRTTSTVVPDEFATIQQAIDSELIDSGDTINVKPGYYPQTLYIAGKDVLIQSTDGYKNTILTKTELPDSIDQQRVVNISSGRLEGFTITKGAPWHGSGGGIAMAKDAIVSNCLIIENTAHAYKNGGYGGGVFIADNGKLYNNIIVNNACFRQLGTGIYVLSAYGEIINNTIINNEILISDDCSGLTIRNNVFYQNPVDDIIFHDNNDQNGVVIDFSLFGTSQGIGTNNLYSDPIFIDNIDFIPRFDCPTIDSGHPSEVYNDTDGTRNDMGAYGGTFNNKQ